MLQRYVKNLANFTVNKFIVTKTYFLISYIIMVDCIEFVLTLKEKPSKHHMALRLLK